MSPDLSRLRVQLFSEPLLQGPDGPYELSPYQSAFLTLIFAEGSIARPRVVELLWPNRPLSRGRQSIRQLKSEIRRRSGGHVVAAEGDLLVAADAVASDLRELSQHLDRGDLAEAARMIEGGLRWRDAGDLPEGFDDWRVQFHTALRERILQQARGKWTACRSESDWTAARDAAEALYRLCPLDAEFAANVIEARGRAGRLQAAEVAYAEFRDRVALESEDDAVEEAIERVRALADAEKTRPSPTRIPFVGRKSVLREFVSIFDDVRHGTFSFALVSGEAGIGKTRLIREVERTARLEGFRCITAEPVELESRISLNPLIDALSSIDLGPHLDAIGEPWRTVIGTMLPPGPHAESVQKLPPIEEKNLSRRLLDAFSLLLRSISNEQPTIFFLDDLQWADATTIAALRFYQRRWTESYFGVIGTVRPTDVGRKSPAASYVDDDGKLDVKHLALSELQESEARRLVQLVAEDDIAEGDVTKLCALSGRHPLYLTELTRDYLSGRLVLPESEEDAFTIPISLRQILGSRMHGVGEEARAILSTLAVGSKPMRLSDLGEILDLSLDRAADSADELFERQLVELDRDRIWIAHELFRAAIYRELSEPRKAVVHRRIAEHIRAGSGEEAANELATHFERAGQDELAAKYGWIAAGRAFARGAVDEAAHFYELVTRNEPDQARRAEATAQLALSLHLNRDMSRANPALELASTRLRAVDMTELARRMDIRRVEGLAEAGDTPVDELIERLGAIKAEAREAEDWEGVALALDTELGRLQLANRIAAVRALHPQFSEVLRAGDEAAAAVAHQALAVGLMLDDAEAALESARKGVALTARSARGLRLKALNRLIIVLLHHGKLHLEENRHIVEEARGLAQRTGDLHQRFSFESNMGVSYMDAGELGIAGTHFDRAGSLLGKADMTFPRINLAFNQGELALARKDFAAAAKFFASATKHAGLAIPGYTEQLINAGLGLCALEQGRVSEARKRHEALKAGPETWYYDPTVVLLFRARFMQRRGNLDSAIRLLEEAQSGLENRLVAAWLKTQLTLSRMMRIAKDSRSRTAAERGLRVAAELRLKTREREFRALLSDERA